MPPDWAAASGLTAMRLCVILGALGDRYPLDPKLLNAEEMVRPNAIRRLHGPPPSAFAHHDRFFGGGDTEVGTVPVP